MKQIEDYIVPSIASVPVSVAATLLADPFWEWFEETTGIESIGHFGPSAWCFFIMYVIILGAFMLLQKYLYKRKNPKA